jgi:4-amino-4-deoxy-L-arabinose transferase-like glycosyltransferase
VSFVQIVLNVVLVGVLVVTLYSFVDAATQRPDAYTAADKLTKPVWLVILGLAMPLAWLLGMFGIVAAACAAGVYLVDVRPKLLEVQGKSR